MNLKATVEILEKVKPTKAKGFSELEVGDIVELHYNLNGCYGSAATIDVLKDGKVVTSCYASQLQNNLARFKVKQVG